MGNVGKKTKDWYIQLRLTYISRGYGPILDYVRTTLKQRMSHRLIYDIDRTYYNVTEFNKEYIKSFQDTNGVPVLLYFTKLLVFKKFTIAGFALIIKLQQTMTLY